VIGAQNIHFDDREVAREVLKDLDSKMLRRCLIRGRLPLYSA